MTISSVVFQPADQPLDSAGLARDQLLKPGASFHSSEAAETIDRLFASGYYEDIRVEGTQADGKLEIRIITERAWFIGHVEVEGSVHSPPSDTELADAARLNLGTQFYPEDLKQAEQSLQRLFERNGLYENTFHIEQQDDADTGQRNFTIVVDAGPRARYARPNIEGDPKLSEDAIIKATGWTRFVIGGWKRVSQAQTRNGVTGIVKQYQKEARLSASVRLESPTYNAVTRGMKPRLNIVAGPKIDVKAVEAKVSQRTLKRYVPIFDQQTVSRDLLMIGARNLRDYFQSKGYYDVVVDFRERETDSDHQLIEYVIALGDRAKLVHIEITGNRYFSREDLRERMFLEPASFLQFRHGRYSRGFLEKDEETISELYRSNGFRDVKVTSSVDKSYQNKPGEVAVTIHVEEGPQRFISSLSLSGFANTPGQDLRGSLASLEGQVFSELNIAEDRNLILTRYQAAGYPNAAFEWNMTPAGEPNRVNVHYVITPGASEFVRDVLYKGIQTTRMSLVDRNLSVSAGEPLSIVKMASAQRALYQLGVFSRIDMAIQNPEGQTQNKYVLYDFREASRYRFSIGIGAEIARIGGTTTDLSAPVGSAGFSPRFSANVSRLNMFGLGHTTTLRGRVSNLEQLASISYLAPRFRNIEGRNIAFSALYDISRDVRTFSSRREEASIQISQQLSKPSTLLLRFAYRRVTTSDVVIPTLLIPQLLQPVRIGILSASYVQDRRDDPTNAHHGIYNTADVGVASNIFGSQRSFVRGLFRNATYYSLTRNVVLARQTTFGLIIPFHVPPGLTAQDYIPLPERFFGGGSVTHRGFPENQAGPRDIGAPTTPGEPNSQPTGFPLGGNALLFNNVELRFPLIGENIGGVLFHDMGNIYNSLGAISFRVRQPNLQDFGYMVHAVGFGIRYRTPVGPLRVDLAYSFNPPTFIGFKGTEQELLACGPQGSNTCPSVQDSIGHFQFFFSIGQTF